jgi:hypothetical protein
VATHKSRDVELQTTAESTEMQLTPDNILQAALNLPEEQRLDLAARLLDTVPSGALSVDDPDFIAELDRRFNDGSPAIPWSEIRDAK